ncbi:hypothetical protein [Nocardia sp. NBC_01329]|uniref:hypothetical protein n=1 Tax=Nocardia sp. NBC_01329 TaxID=2903594 RepID=UPI002E14BCC6|nr:hypothetical protein OG405_20105 [Nocardia sp. NBC_01329]
MREVHPTVQVALDAAREMRHRVAEFRERADRIVARRPSPSGFVIPEVDAFGRLRDLYLAPGTCARFGNAELVAEIMAAITESSDDARRQYHVSMNDDSNRPPPLAEVMRERWSGTAGTDEVRWSPPVRRKNNEEMGGGKG